MKKTINFNKGFLPTAILSVAIIIFGLIGFFVKGINFGLDFKPGLIEEVRVANPVLSVVYNGSAKLAVDLSAGQMDVVISGSGVENETRSINFANVKTVADLATELNKIENVSATVLDGSYETTKLFLNSAVTNQLTDEAMYIYPAGTSEITTDDIRLALGSQSIDVKQLGSGADASYQIRMLAHDLPALRFKEPGGADRDCHEGAGSMAELQRS